MFNYHCINSVDENSGITSKHKFDNLGDDKESVKSIIKQYQNHSSILGTMRKFHKQE